MGLGHILSSIGEFETDKTRQFIDYVNSARLQEDFIKANQPVPIVSGHEIILYRAWAVQASAVNYRKHALLMAPLVIVIIALLFSLVPVNPTEAQVQSTTEKYTVYDASDTEEASSFARNFSSTASITLQPQELQSTPTPTPGQLIPPSEQTLQSSGQSLPVSAQVFPAPSIIPPTPTATPAPVVSSPSHFDSVYKSAGTRYGVPWQILYGIHLTEAGLRYGPISNYQGSGAQGPMQFMPGTWRAYGVDGNGDGVVDINNAVDAIYGAANYLSQHGSLDQALTDYGTNKARVYSAARSLGWNG